MSNYNTKTMNLAPMFKALGNPHRLALFTRLSNCCSPGTHCDVEVATQHCVSALGEEMTIAASTLSHHLKELNRAGLIQMKREGKNVNCWVEPATLKSLSIFFSSPFQKAD